MIAKTAEIIHIRSGIWFDATVAVGVNVGVGSGASFTAQT